MKPHVVTLAALAGLTPLCTGCSYPLKGYSWREWNSLPSAERRRLVDQRFPSNPEMHRALAEDAKKVSEGYR